MNRRILRLAIPNIISNLSVPMLGAVDTALMGHEDNAKLYLGAIAIGTAIFNFIYWGFGFLRMGTTGLTAQAFGGQDQAEALHILGRGLIVAAGGSVMLLLFQVPLGEMGFYLMESSPEAERVARGYFDIRIWAAPATIGLYAFHGWFLGMQNAVYPMILAIFVNLLNLVANLIFVKGFGMQAEGIALGTVIAQYLGLFLAIGMFFFKYRDLLRLGQRKLLLATDKLRHFFTVNGDILIRTLCLVFTFNFFIARSGFLGDDMLSANHLLLQLLTIMAFVVDGFAFSAESLVGWFSGKGDQAQLKESIKKIFYWGAGAGIVFSLVYAFGGEWILGLFTNEVEVISLAMPYMLWLMVLPFLASFAYIWDGIYLGLSASRPMRNSMLVSTFGIFLPAWAFLHFIWADEDMNLENHALWIAMVLFMIARTVLLGAVSKKIIFKKGPF